jgi:hypothetical protein
MKKAYLYGSFAVISGKVIRINNSKPGKTKNKQLSKLTLKKIDRAIRNGQFRNIGYIILMYKVIVQLKLYTSNSGVYAVCCKAISESRLALNSYSFVTAIGSRNILVWYVGRKNADKQNKTKHTTPKSKKKTSNMKPTKI